MRFKSMFFSSIFFVCMISCKMLYVSGTILLKYDKNGAIVPTSTIVFHKQPFWNNRLAIDRFGFSQNFLIRCMVKFHALATALFFSIHPYSGSTCDGGAPNRMMESLCVAAKSKARST